MCCEATSSMIRTNSVAASHWVCVLGRERDVCILSPLSVLLPAMGSVAKIVCTSKSLDWLAADFLTSKRTLPR